MLTPLNVAVVVGSTSVSSRTLQLARSLIDQLSLHLVLDAHYIELSKIGRPLGTAFSREELPDAVEQQLRRIEDADLVLAAAPVYRGSYPGLFKHLFDLIEQQALVDTPVLLAATGGSERHALVIEHHLRPLFGFLQALTLPIGVYATTADFTETQISSPQLRERIALAARRAAGLLGGAHSQRLRRIA